MTAHILYLLHLNGANAANVIGALLVIFAVSGSLTNKNHMLCYSVFVCLAALLASATSAGLPRPIFVCELVRKFCFRCPRR